MPTAPFFRVSTPSLGGLLAAALLVLFPPFLPAAHANEAQVGAVDRARGPAVIKRAILERPARAGRAVLFQDVLETGAAARLYVTFDDGSRLMMGDESRLTVDEMVYEPGKTGRGALMLSRGVFRMVSGQVNKVAGGTLSVITPVAHIGVRGTDFWGEQTAARLLLALLGDGELTVTTEHGTVILRQPNTAVEIERGQAPGPVFELSAQQVRDAAATVSW